MKILYAIQGTGNGHLCRATDIIPILKQKGDVDVLVSGGDLKLSTPFQVHYRLNGLGFSFGKNGGIDFWKTFKEIKLKRVINEIKSLPIKQYDIIINDFEPLSAWAGKLNNIPVVALSHQIAVIDSFSPKPKSLHWLELLLIKYYAPSNYKYGFHFKPYNKQIFTPVIRSEIRNKIPVNQNHYTVYLPAYSDKKIIKILSYFKNIQWQVFSKNANETYLINNIVVYPIQSNQFINSMTTCKGVLCGAGFETPAEALYLKKKLLVIPMKSQFEQKCNAKALEEMGITVIKNLHLKYLNKINNWLLQEKKVIVDYPNISEDIINTIFDNHVYKANTYQSNQTEINLS